MRLGEWSTKVNRWTARVYSTSKLMTFDFRPPILNLICGNLFFHLSRGRRL
jgi:hypothetical protein